MNRLRMLFPLLLATTLPCLIAPAHAQDDEAVPSSRKPVALTDIRFRDETRIVGGTPATKGEIPWQAALIATIDGVPYLCGGSVIRPGWVLTAAHCVEDKQVMNGNKASVIPPDQLDVRTGSRRVGSGGLESEAERIYVMPSRNSRNHAFDVALVRVPTHASAKPIALAPVATTPGAETLTVGTTLRVSGYGTTESGGTSPILLAATVQYIRRTTCNSDQSYRGKVKPSMICAGAPETDSCQGDSGGPLFLAATANQSAKLVGVVSWGIGCADPRYPGIYAQVSHPEIARWIQETLDNP